MKPGGLMAEVSRWRMENGYDDRTAEVQHSHVTHWISSNERKSLDVMGVLQMQNGPKEVVE